jgi:hypothetical protein
MGNELILTDIGKLCRSSACLVRITGPCPAEPFQLVPAQLGLSPAGSYQLWCTSLRITTETRPVRNNILPARTIRVLDMQTPGLPLHARLLAVGRLELSLIKSVDLSPTMQDHARRDYYY